MGELKVVLKVVVDSAIRAWTATRDYERALEQVRRVMNQGGMVATPTQYLYRTWWTPEDLVSTMDNGRKMKMGDHLYVTSKDNHGAHVQVVGWNLEHDPICQRLDGEPFQWGGVRRHVLDIPAHCLSYKKPERSLLAAADAVVRMYVEADPKGLAFELMADLAAVVEREKAKAS